jgi:hypothetical protein
MAQPAAYGTISATEAYTLEQLALILNRPRAWAYNTFIRPIDPKTKRRLDGPDGEPLEGVFHFRSGTNYIIPGQALLAWISEHGTRYIDHETD